MSGIRKILIIELKRGGFCVRQPELDQARDYAKELHSTGCAQPTTEIEAYVLGANLEASLQQMAIGDRTIIRPILYDLLLDKAHPRVFQLHRRIMDSRPAVPSDIEVQEVLEQPNLDDSFDQNRPIDL